MEAGAAAAARGDWPAAARGYRAALAADTDSYEAKFQLARSLAFSGEREEAVRLYGELLARNPANSDVLLSRGRVLTWLGRRDEAERDLRAAAEKSPTYADVWSALGDLYFWSDRHAEAIAAYSRLAELRPDDPGPLLSRGKVHRGAGDRENARADFEAARVRGAADSEVLALLATLQERRSNPASEVPEGFGWSASASYQEQDFSPFRDGWSEANASVRRYFPRGSLAFEGLRAGRFRKSDEAYALDAYVDLWTRSYANLRYQWSPNAELYPDRAYRAELFQGAGRGWELAASYDYLGFGNSNTDIYGAALGKYWRNFYFRARTIFVPSTPTLGLNHRGLVRWYWAGNADDYVEASAGWSRGGEFVRNTTAERRTKGESYGAVYQRYFTPRWGVKFSFSYGDDENSFVDRSFSTSLMTRW